MNPKWCSIFRTIAMLLYSGTDEKRLVPWSEESHVQNSRSVGVVRGLCSHSDSLITTPCDDLRTAP